MKFNKQLVTATVLSLSFLLPSTALAGGGLVSFNVNPSAILNPGDEFVVSPQTYTDIYGGTPCRNCQIQIKLENPQPDDYIAQSSSVTDNNGTMYAKVISHISGNRLAYAEVLMPNGLWYKSSEVVLNYYEKGPIKTSPVPVTVVISTTPETSKPQPINHPIKVEPTTSQPIQVITTPVPSVNPQELDQLNQKVDNLQNQLEQTQKQQAQTESQLDHIVSWLKSVFPFFGK